MNGFCVMKFMLLNTNALRIFRERWLIFKDTLEGFNDLKNKQKSVWSNAFWYVKVCIFWKCIQYTIHWDKIQMLKEFSSNEINGTKNALFF